MSVLVMAVGSPLGQSIYKALRASRLSLRLFRADVSSNAAGFYLDDAATNVLLPFVRDPCYRQAIADVIREHQIDVVFPVIAPEFEFFGGHAAEFASQGVTIVMPDEGLYDLCHDKYRSVQALQAHGLAAPDTVICAPTPEFEAFFTCHTFPVVLKPRRGASSSNVFVVSGRDQLDALARAFPDTEFVVQEYLSDPLEYTVGVYVSRDRRIGRTIVMRRELKFGLSYRGEVIEHEEISKYCLDVCLALGLHFSTNVQLKLADGRPCAFEINPRLSSTTSVRAHFGFNEPEMILQELRRELSDTAGRPSTGSFMRYWEEAYVDNR